MSILSLAQKDNEEEKDINTEIERLIDTYGNDVLRTAYMYVKDKDKADDIFQEVFIKVFKKYDTFKGNSSEKTWLMTITINTCKDYLKSFWIKRVFLNNDKDDKEDGTDLYDENTIEYNYSLEDEVLKKIEGKEILKEVLNLPIKYKEVIILYYYEQFNTREISDMIKLPEGTVRTRLVRARDMLKKSIADKMNDY